MPPNEAPYQLWNHSFLMKNGGVITIISKMDVDDITIKFTEGGVIYILGEDEHHWPVHCYIDTSEVCMRRCMPHGAYLALRPNLGIS